MLFPTKIIFLNFATLPTKREAAVASKHIKNVNAHELFWKYSKLLCQIELAPIRRTHIHAKVAFASHIKFSFFVLPRQTGFQLEFYNANKLNAKLNEKSPHRVLKQFRLQFFVQEILKSDRMMLGIPVEKKDRK